MMQYRQNLIAVTVVFSSFFFPQLSSAAEEIKLFGLGVGASELDFKDQFRLAKCARELKEPKHIRDVETDAKVIEKLQKKYEGKNLLEVGGTQVSINLCEFLPNNEKFNPAFAAFYNGALVFISRAYLPDEAIVVPQLNILVAELSKRTGVQAKVEKGGFGNSIHVFDLGAKGRIEVEARAPTKIKGVDVPARVIRLSFSNLVLENLQKQKWKEFLQKEAHEEGTGGA